MPVIYSKKISFRMSNELEVFTIVSFAILYIKQFVLLEKKSI